MKIWTVTKFRFFSIYASFDFSLDIFWKSQEIMISKNSQNWRLCSFEKVLFALSRAWNVILLDKNVILDQIKFGVGYLNFFKIQPLKKFPRQFSKSYDVPSWCDLKARKWDIEAFETALETSESVLFAHGGSNSNKWTLSWYKFDLRT